MIYFSPEWLKKWKIFRSYRRSIYALIIFGFLLFSSLGAEFIANNRPHILFYQGQLYFPILKKYSPSVFDFPSETITVDYKKIKLKEKDWAVWPLIRWNPYESNIYVESYPSKPSSENWMGTDNRGRDVFTRILYGFRYSIVFSIFVWIGTYLLGVFLGMVMGFKAGWWDLIGQRVVEIFQSIPVILVLITIVSVLGLSFIPLIIYSVCFGWMSISLYMRSEFLKVRKMEFIQSAKAYGASSFRIMLKHILPNSLVPIITFSPFRLAHGIYSLAVLDYLGFGLPPPTPSWGELFLQAEQYFIVGWWLALFPSFFLFLSLVSLNFIGEGIQQAFNPKR